MTNIEERAEEGQRVITKTFLTRAEVSELENDRKIKHNKPGIHNGKPVDDYIGSDGILYRLHYKGRKGYEVVHSYNLPNRTPQA